MKVFEIGLYFYYTSFLCRCLMFCVPKVLLVDVSRILEKENTAVCFGRPFGYVMYLPQGCNSRNKHNYINHHKTSKISLVPRKKNCILLIYHKIYISKIFFIVFLKYKAILHTTYLVVTNTVQNCEGVFLANSLAEQANT